MKDKALTYSIAAAVAFCALAIVFAGAGGMAEGRWRTTLAACSGFWLLMLLVPWIFVSQGRALTSPANLGITMAVGAVAGLCLSLCFEPGAGLFAIVETMVLGAGMGLMGFCASWVRHRPWS